METSESLNEQQVGLEDQIVDAGLGSSKPENLPRPIYSNSESGKLDKFLLGHNYASPSKENEKLLG